MARADDESTRFRVLSNVLLLVAATIAFSGLILGCSLGFLQASGATDLVATIGVTPISRFAFDGDLKDSLTTSQVATSISSSLTYVKDRNAKDGKALALSPVSGSTVNNPGVEFATNLSYSTSFDGATISLSFWFARLTAALPNTTTTLEIVLSPTAHLEVVTYDPHALTADVIATSNSASTVTSTVETSYPFPLRTPDYSGSSWGVGKWHNVVLTVDLLDRLRIYLDGRFAAETAGTSSIGTIRTIMLLVSQPGLVSNTTTQAGSPLTSPFFAIDDLNLFSGALTARQVKQIYQGTFIAK